MKPVGGAKIPYVHFILRKFLYISCEDSVLIVQNTQRRKVIKQCVWP